MVFRFRTAVSKEIIRTAGKRGDLRKSRTGKSFAVIVQNRKFYYSQPGHYSAREPVQRRALIENIAYSIDPAPKEIQIRHIGTIGRSDRR